MKIHFEAGSKRFVHPDGLSLKAFGWQARVYEYENGWGNPTPSTPKANIAVDVKLAIQDGEEATTLYVYSKDAGFTADNNHDLPEFFEEMDAFFKAYLQAKEIYLREVALKALGS